MDNERVVRTANVQYSYDNSGFGKLDESSTNVYVDAPGGQIHDHYFALSISHPNFLSCKMVDGANVTIIYEDFDKTLRELIDEMRVKNITPIHRYSHISDAVNFYDVVLVEFRIIISSMINFIIYLHDHGKSLAVSKLSLDNNFVSKDSVIKYRRLSFCDANLESKRRDFELLYNLLTQEIFSGYERHLPYDMENLLSKMTVDYTEEIEKLLGKHLAILNHQKRILFIRSCSEIRSMMRQSHFVDYQRIISGMSNCRNWTRRFRRNAHFEPVDRFFYSGLNDGYNSTEAQIHGKYRDCVASQMECNEYFLRFCRNLATHLDEQLQADGEFSDVDIDCMIMHAFGRQLVDFQEVVHGFDYLDSFMRSC